MAGITLILNATAGTAERKKSLVALRTALKSRNGSIQILEARAGNEIAELAKKALESGATIIAAAGGDGTVSSVAAKMLESGHPGSFGVVPFGTLNHFAKDNAIPIEAEKAVACLEGAKVQAIDVAEVNGKYFLNNSSIGMYPHMVKLRDSEESKGLPKFIANIASVFTVLKRGKYVTVRLKMEGKEIVRKSPLVFIGNNKYEFEGMNIGTRTRLDEGVLSIIIPHSVSRPGLIWLSIKALLGLARRSKDLDYFYAPEVVIEPPHSEVLVSTDGEVNRMRSPLQYRLHPKALRLIVP